MEEIWLYNYMKRESQNVIWDCQNALSIIYENIGRSKELISKSFLRKKFIQFPTKTKEYLKDEFIESVLIETKQSIKIRKSLAIWICNSRNVAKTEYEKITWTNCLSDFWMYHIIKHGILISEKDILENVLAEIKKYVNLNSSIQTKNIQHIVNDSESGRIYQSSEDIYHALPRRLKSDLAKLLLYCYIIRYFQNLNSLSDVKFQIKEFDEILMDPFSFAKKYSFLTNNGSSLVMKCNDLLCSTKGEFISLHYEFTKDNFQFLTEENQEIIENVELSLSGILSFYEKILMNQGLDQTKIKTKREIIERFLARHDFDEDGESYEELIAESDINCKRYIEDSFCKCTYRYKRLVNTVWYYIEKFSNCNFLLDCWISRNIQDTKFIYQNTSEINNYLNSFPFVMVLPSQYDNVVGISPQTLTTFPLSEEDMKFFVSHSTLVQVENKSHVEMCNTLIKKNSLFLPEIFTSDICTNDMLIVPKWLRYFDIKFQISIVFKYYILEASKRDKNDEMVQKLNYDTFFNKYKDQYINIQLRWIEKIFKEFPICNSENTNFSFLRIMIDYCMFQSNYQFGLYSENFLITLLNTWKSTVEKDFNKLSLIGHPPSIFFPKNDLGDQIVQEMFPDFGFSLSEIHIDFDFNQEKENLAKEKVSKYLEDNYVNKVNELKTTFISYLSKLVNDKNQKEFQAEIQKFDSDSIDVKLIKLVLNFGNAGEMFCSLINVENLKPYFLLNVCNEQQHQLISNFDFILDFELEFFYASLFRKWKDFHNMIPKQVISLFQAEQIPEDKIDDYLNIVNSVSENLDEQFIQKTKIELTQCLLFSNDKKEITLNETNEFQNQEEFLDPAEVIQ